MGHFARIQTRPLTLKKTVFILPGILSIEQPDFSRVCLCDKLVKAAIFCVRTNSWHFLLLTFCLIWCLKSNMLDLKGIRRRSSCISEVYNLGWVVCSLNAIHRSWKSRYLSVRMDCHKAGLNRDSKKISHMGTSNEVLFISERKIGNLTNQNN